MGRTFKSSEIESSLLRKGFSLDFKKHRYFHHEYNGKKTGVFTYVSHGKKEYSGNLLGSVKKQLKLQSLGQLTNLIDCPMSADDYIQYLKEINVIL